MTKELLTMSHKYKYQFFILKTTAAFICFYVKLLGLWPYKVDNTTSQIKYSSVKVIYSIVLPCIVISIFLIIAAYVFGGKLSLGSTTLNVLFQIYGWMNMISYVSLYVGQHLKSKKTKLLYVKSLEFTAHNSTSSVDFRKYLVYYFLKVVILDIFHFFLFWINLMHTSVEVNSKPYLPLILYAPFFAIRLHANLLYCGILIINVILKQINSNLDNIVNKTKSVSKNNSDNQIHCSLSDELDKLSKLHFKLSKATEEFNLIFEFQILLWIIVELAGLVLRFFYQYVGIVKLSGKIENFNYILTQNFIMLGACVVTTLEIIIVSCACESLVAEVYTFCNILPYIHTLRQTDSRGGLSKHTTLIFFKRPACSSSAML